MPTKGISVSAVSPLSAFSPRFKMPQQDVPKSFLKMYSVHYIRSVVSGTRYLVHIVYLDRLERPLNLNFSVKTCRNISF